MKGIPTQPGQLWRIVAQRGHTLTELAIDTGIAMSTLIRINRGREIAGPTLRKLRSWLQAHPVDPNLAELLGPAIPLQEMRPPEDDDQTPAPACR